MLESYEYLKRKGEPNGSPFVFKLVSNLVICDHYKN